MITRNLIYDTVANAVMAAHPNAYCTSVYEPIPPSLPAVFIREIGRFSSIEGVTLDNQSDQWRDTFEVQIFSDKIGGALSEAYSILDAARSAFKRMYFIQESELPVDNTDESIYRLTARFYRTIGGGDTLPNEV